MVRRSGGHATGWKTPVVRFRVMAFGAGLHVVETLTFTAASAPGPGGSLAAAGRG
jgi:hypothetical protein